MVTHHLYPSNEFNNFYTNESNTVNIKYESKTNHFIKFNWGHGIDNIGNCLSILESDVWTPYLPIQSRTKIYDEDCNTFKIDFYCRRADVVGTNLYFTPENSTNVEHCSIIFHKNDHCHASAQ